METKVLVQIDVVKTAIEAAKQAKLSLKSAEEISKILDRMEKSVIRGE
jgi:hypothetical protein